MAQRSIFVILFICAASLLSLGSSSVIPWPPKIMTMNQTVDHFSFGASNDVFSQRILFENKWWNGRGPIFFYCGNEGPIESFWNNTGFVFETAIEFSGLVIYGEHRYYGQSLPFGQNSFKQPNLKYLSIGQAIADYAYMVNYVKDLFKTGVPVIAVGGSYGGQLAAYMRFKYPNLVLGAIAASSPIYWVAGLGDFHQFFLSVSKTCRGYDSECPDRIKSAYDQIIQLTKNGSSGLQELSSTFRLCSSLKGAQDVDQFLRWSRNAFVTMAMSNYPYSANAMGDLPANPLQKACEATKLSGPAGLRDAVAIMYNASAVSCFDIYAEYINCADITGCGLGNDALAWDFQACTELALYDSAVPQADDMFPYLPVGKSNVDLYCKNKYGVKRADRQIELLFWSNNIKASSNIVFSNGDLDPWHLGGVLSNISDSVVTFLVKGGAHHLDLRESNPKDPVSAVEVRSSERQMIRQWLSKLQG